ncbi:hypothetical protein [Solibacillus cecembensis]|uniref:hypothetical protein n=1 Tax=Solibacillus cecembensis TaxID=459347 RepID=UPI003D0584C2
MIAVLAAVFCCPLFLFYRKDRESNIPFWHKGVSMMRTIRSEIVRHGLCNKEKKVATKRRQPPPKKKEVLSTREIEELMGIRRDIYTRKNGAIRRK